MKILRFFTKKPMGAAVTATLATALLAPTPVVLAATDVNVWHSLNPHNKQVFEGLVKRFNRSQDEVHVRLQAFDDTPAIDGALAMVDADDARPHLVQLDETKVPDMSAYRSYIQPLHQLLAKHPIGTVNWFLPPQNTAARDGQGRLTAFPYMLDVPVMFYNVAALEKAGLSPAKPSRSWSTLQKQVVTAANKGSRQCPITSDQPVSINLENLAAVNNQNFVTQGPGGAPVFKFDALYIRHLSLMISWVRSELMVKPEFNSVASERFENGECAILLSHSGNLGWFDNNRGLNYAVSAIPYYPEVTETPGLPFVGGAALWATKGHGEQAEAATAAFLGWLSKPEQAQTWFENTGFLPLTQDAYDNAAFKSEAMQQWAAIVAPYAKEPVATSRGFKINNYPEIRALFNKTMDSALGGEQSAVSALQSASEAADKLSGKAP